MKPDISFCIPTFNRCEKVFRLVTEILKYDGDEIEVIVLDNCSSDSTRETLATIVDKRFFFFENEKNIGGILNPLKVLTLAKGEYAFLCLDKDLIHNESIKPLINRVKKLSDVGFGCCLLNSKMGGQSQADKIYQAGFESLYFMSYMSQHPTGYFYKTEEYIRLKILKKLFNEHHKFGFYFDILNAEMALENNSIKINLPAFYTESIEECETTPSFTYKSTDVFFAPNQRLFELGQYLKHVDSLKLDSKSTFKIVRRIYRQVLDSATIGYKKIMSNSRICEHYRVSPKSIKTIELWRVNFLFLQFLLNTKMSISLFKKTIIACDANLRNLAKPLFFKRDTRE